MGFERWWVSRDLVNLVAHHLVDTGEITTTTALLLYFERPYEHDEAFKSAMRAMADGKERGPLVATEDRGMPLAPPGPVPVRHVGIRLPPTVPQECLFDLEAAA